MSGVLCPVRAGIVSRTPIDTAVSLADQNESKLYFLLVIDSNVFTNVSAKQLQALEKEMRELGKVVLPGAQSLAYSKGVLSEGLVREGQVDDEIISVSKKLRPDYIVLGHPQKKFANNLFTQDKIENLKHRIEEETPAELVLV